MVPGLLQTEAYARRDAERPAAPEEERIAARMERQKLLTRKPPIAFSFIVEEAVLLRDTGGEDVT